MTCQKKSHQIAAARACQGKAFENVAVKVNSDIDTVVTSWTGGVNNHELEQEWIDLDELSEEEVSELEGDDLIESLRTLSGDFKKIFRKHWPLFKLRPYGNGNTG
jgi:hypothetical protein